MQRHLTYYYYFFSLTTDVNYLSQNPRVPAALRDMNHSPGVCPFILFCFWLTVNLNSLSSSVNGYSEGRLQIANVGVHSFISTIDSEYQNPYFLDSTEGYYGLRRVRL